MKTTFIAQVNKEFRMREWANEHNDGSFMTIKQKVAKLKAQLMNGRKINVLRESIKRVADKEEGFVWFGESCSLCATFGE